MKTNVALLSLFAGAMLGGCSSAAYKVNYMVEPPGATLYVGSREFKGDYDQLEGKATGYYAKNKEALENYTKANGCYNVSAVRAVWVSGASVTYKPRLCDGQGTYTVHLRRPKNHPNLTADIEYYKALIAKERSTRERNQALAEIINAATKKKTKCTSIPIDGIVYTTCDD